VETSTSAKLRSRRLRFGWHGVVGCTLTPLAWLGTLSRKRERGDKDEELI